MKQGARLVVALVLVCVAAHAPAQDTLRNRYGVQGGLSFNLHSADFQALPGIPNCCSMFERGSGIGPLAAVFYEHPTSNNVLLSLRAGFADHSALLSKREPYRLVVAGVGQDMVDEHTIDATLTSIGVEPAVSYRAFGNLFVSIGARVGLMLSKSYSQKEQIVEPAGTGTFLDSLGNDSHSRTRNASSGTIPDAASIIAHMTAGIRYELPLNAAGTLMLAPEASYAYALTNVVGALNWKPNGVHAAVSVIYSPKPDNRIRTFDTVYIRDTVRRTVRGLAAARITLASTDERNDELVTGNTVLERTTVHERYEMDLPDEHDISAFVQAFGLDDEGREQSIATLKIEEFLSTRVHPLLAYIFFGEGDSVMPLRYSAIDAPTAKRFKLEQLFGKQPLEIYHTVLNIIGYRLKNTPNATLTLTGCNSNQAAELGAREISRARAEAVKRYFMDTWGIPASRLITSARDLPEKPSNPRTPDGQEENRRVEIACNVPEVLDVFVAHDTARTPLPPQVRLKLAATATGGVGDWRVDVTQGARTLKRFSGTGAVPQFVDWDLANDPASLPTFGDPLRVTIGATTIKGDRAGSELLLPTEILTIEQKKARKIGDVIIDRYNLVLFNFGTSDITTAHERTVNMVKSKLQPSSSIAVDGYTDRTGSNASNRTLSLSRAESTANALEREGIAVRGLGEDRLLYPNDTPEGRFFCRTVQITVKTAVH
jgi:outer membrane protein OmpA-like peptidoglycan-associated protein